MVELQETHEDKLALALQFRELGLERTVVSEFCLGPVAEEYFFEHLTGRQVETVLRI